MGYSLHHCALEFESHHEILELPRITKDAMLLSRLLLLPLLGELDQEPNLEWTSRVEKMSRVAMPGVRPATRSGGISTGAGDHESTSMITFLFFRAVLRRHDEEVDVQRLAHQLVDFSARAAF